MASKGKVFDYMQRPTYRPATSEQFTKILRDVPLARIEAELEYLLSQRLIKKINGEKYVLNYAGEPDPFDASISYEGVISIIRSGAGFVKLEDGKEFFVEKNNVGGALNNDKVKISPVINKRSDRDLEEARVTQVITRSKDFFVAQVVSTPDGGLSVACDDLRMSLPIVLDSYKNLVPGSKILIKIGSYEADKCYGTVSRILGHVNDPGVDILSIVMDNGIKYEFDEQTEEYVNNLEFKITDEDRAIRKDLSSVPIVTIDPWDAKDLDDAIYVEQRADGTFFLSVSIADVS